MFFAMMVQAEPLTNKPSIESGFSPDVARQGDAEKLVLEAIKSAHYKIDLLSSSLTSQPIADALLFAHKNKIDVRIVVDKNKSKSNDSKAKDLSAQGMAIQVDGLHQIQHNNYMIIDDNHLQTGSFGYLKSAKSNNAENAMVLWNYPDEAKKYTKDFNTHWEHSITKRKESRE
jgi:phosphatidylserine/phosphatidylglycerophosphate/cardiolipin synthase-like enzyme